MNLAYPLIPVILLCLLAYLSTRLFKAWGIISGNAHRRFWNYLLLLTFLVSGLLGILSVVKVNYKLEIPHYDSYLQWHVSFGIAMVLIAFIHLSWHLSYYFRPGKGKTAIQTADPNHEIPAKRIRNLLFLLGMESIMVQVLLIREFITVLSGNELVTGIVLSSWMLLTGFGAWLGRRSRSDAPGLKRILIMLLALTLIPMVTTGLLYLLKSMLFPPGTVVGPGPVILAALVLLFPLCILSGYLFTLLSGLYSFSEKRDRTGRSYAAEALGSMAGGLLFTLLLGRFFTTFEVLALCGGFIALAAGFLLRKEQRGHSYLFYITAGVLPLIVFLLRPDMQSRRLIFPHQEILENRSTPYGNLTLTRQAGQLNVYMNDALLFYTNNVMEVEESVHFAMIQHPGPRNVLLLSGAVAGMGREVLKYGVEEVSCLEVNPALFSQEKDIPGLFPDTAVLKQVRKDIRRFVAGSDEQYDVILMNLPPPSSLGINRFYTLEFFNSLKRHCDGNTVLCTSLPATANYTDEQALDALSSLWNTLGQVFEHRLLLSGEKNYFLASDSPLSGAITEQIEARQIETSYVNSYFIDDGLLGERGEALCALFDPEAPVNRDFQPFIFTREIGYWLSRFSLSYRLLLVLPLILFLIILLRTDRITAGLYTGGFTAAALEILLLLAYQVHTGSIYLATALFFAVFMGGLALGSSDRIPVRRPAGKNYYLVQAVLAVLTLLLPLLLKMAGLTGKVYLPVQLLFFLLLFILAFTVGLEFRLAADLKMTASRERAGLLYATDLSGSALGAFLAALVLLPLLGMFRTCLLLAGLNIISATLAFSLRKSA